MQSERINKITKSAYNRIEALKEEQDFILENKGYDSQRQLMTQINKLIEQKKIDNIKRKIFSFHEECAEKIHEIKDSTVTQIANIEEETDKQIAKIEAAKNRKITKIQEEASAEIETITIQSKEKILNEIEALNKAMEVSKKKQKVSDNFIEKAIDRMMEKLEKTSWENYAHSPQESKVINR